MARLKLNSALSHISGGIDDWVYRKVDGKMVISRRPVVTAEPTPAQLGVRVRFGAAAGYARSASANPASRAFYAALAKSRKLPLFSVMLADYLNPPTVEAVDLTGYHGAVNDPIAIRATDDTGVVSVSVAIRAADLTVLEEGAAALESGVWVYRATTARTAGQAVTIAATALDRPGNTAVKTEPWS